MLASVGGVILNNGEQEEKKSSPGTHLGVTIVEGDRIESISEIAS